MYYPETVVRLRATTGTDAHGNQTPGTPAELTITGVQVQPVSSAEPDPARAAVVTRVRLLTRVGVDVDLLATDQVRWGGYVWGVDGDVARHKRASTGAVHHVEALLWRVAG